MLVIRAIRFYILCLLLGVGIFSTSQAQGRKLALIIAVGDYPGAGWAKLSAKRDAKRMYDALAVQQFQVAVLADAQCTKVGMAQAKEELLGQVRPGDVVWLHYIGHGTRLRDDNYDEADGFDEALVPIDFQHGQPGTFVRDDELGKWLAELRRKAGPSGDVVFSFDACHSGSVTRTGEPEAAQAGVCRGLATEPLEPGPAPEATGYAEAGLGAVADAQMAPYVILAATRADLRVYEVPDKQDKKATMGAFSWAVSQTLATARPPMTYRDFYRQVVGTFQRELSTGQPQLEGSPDRPLFGGGRRGVPAASGKGLPMGAGQPVSLALVAGPAHHQWLLDQLRKEAWLRPNGPAPALRLTHRADSLHLVTAEGELLGKVHGPNAAQAWPAIQATLRQYLRANYLRRLTATSPGLAVELSLLRVAQASGQPPQFEPLLATKGRLTFKEADPFVLRLSNYGSVPAFCHLVDIVPGHRATVLNLQNATQLVGLAQPSPHAGVYLAPGAEVILFAHYPLAFAKGKYGQETIKLVAVAAPTGPGQLPGGAATAFRHWWQQLEQGPGQPMAEPVQVSGIEVLVMKR